MGRQVRHAQRVAIIQKVHMGIIETGTDKTALKLPYPIPFFLKGHCAFIGTGIHEPAIFMSQRPHTGEVPLCTRPPFRYIILMVLSPYPFFCIFFLSS